MGFPPMLCCVRCAGIADTRFHAAMYEICWRNAALIGASTIHRRLRKFGQEIAKRSFKHRSKRGLNWLVPSRDIAAQSPFGKRLPVSGANGSFVSSSRIIYLTS